MSGASAAAPKPIEIDKADGASEADHLALRQLQPSPGPAATICEAFDQYMPSGGICTCVDASKAATITCQVSIDQLFDLGARLVIDICGSPEVAFYYDAGMGYTLGDQFGIPHTDDIPIPGVSVSVPWVVTAHDPNPRPSYQSSPLESVRSNGAH